MKEIIFEAAHLKKTFRGEDQKPAVDDVSFRIYKGECFGLIGESGCGKSTTAGMIAGLIRPSSGELRFYGENMQMVFQNPVMSFSPRMRIINCICEGLNYKSKRSKTEICEKALEAMDMVQLSRDCADRYGSQLSGGECQRAAIARAILIRPELLICDEVTSALDVSVQAQIIKLLRGFQHELGLSILFISHDISLVSSICHRVAVMHRGHIVEVGPTSDVLRNPQHEYTKALIRSALTMEFEY